MMLVLFSLLFTPGMLPTYLAVKQLGLLDSLWALIIPTMVNAFNVIVMHSFFKSLPQELFNSAKIDGASEWQIMVKIVLPLSKAILAVVGLFYGVGYWNSFFTSLLYLNDSSRWPLQMVVRSYVVGGSQLSPAELGMILTHVRSPVRSSTTASREESAVSTREPGTGNACASKGARRIQ